MLLLLVCVLVDSRSSGHADPVARLGVEVADVNLRVSLNVVELARVSVGVEGEDEVLAARMGKWRW